MKRDLPALAAQRFDVLVIGGGAFGAAAAWDATLRGLKVALIEKSDFGSGASAECFKMVHGGIRYLQHADFKRLNFSCAQRSALLRIAPHLVNPLPIVIPTYGYARQGKPFLAAGMFAYDMLTAGRNAGIPDVTRHIAGTELLSTRETLELFPQLARRGLTGAAVFEDGQMYNAARLVLAFVKSAVVRGAVAANYTEALGFLWQGSQVCGVRARDTLDGAEFEIRADLVLNAAGPWAEYLLKDEHFPAAPRGHFSRDACFIVDRRPTSKYALAVPGFSKDSDAVVGRAARHLFAVPWREHTLIGVWHRLFAERPDTAQVEEPELAQWIDEMNAGYPALELTRRDVIYANCGLVPFGDGNSTVGELSFGKESRFIDHRDHGIGGLVTLIGIRYTTSRGDAAKALDLLLAQRPNAPGPAATDSTPLTGGNITDFAALGRAARSKVAGRVPAATLDVWLRNYGTEYRALAELAAETPALCAPVGHSDTVAAEVQFAVQDEMAVRLADVVCRRTNLGSGSHPGALALADAARVMQPLLQWSDARRESEVADTERTLQWHRAAPARAPGVPR